MRTFDVVVIGAGLGGMVAANYLASLGMKTLVVEQSHHTGGNMSGFSRKGYYFDGGDQSFESLGIVFPILAELDVYDQIGWTKCRFRMKSPDFDFFIDSFDQVEEALQAAFPEESGIRPLFRIIREVSKFIEAHCTPWEFPLIHQYSLKHLMRLLPYLSKLQKWIKFSYREKVCSLIRNPELRNWFTHIGYYRMPFLFFAGFWHLWLKDYWYPQGGMQHFHDLLAQRFIQAGGTLRCNTRITQIFSEAGKVTALKTAEGEWITAKRFVYGGDYKRLVLELTDPALWDRGFREKIKETRLTESILNVYLGVRKAPLDLWETLQAPHAFYFPNYRVIFPDQYSPRDIHRSMWIALNHFGTENQNAAPPGHTAVVLQTYSSYFWENCWLNGSSSYPRSMLYKQFKNEIGMQLVETAEQLLPGLKNSIEYFEVGTPLSLERFSLNTEGATGGWCYDTEVSPVFRLPGLNLIHTPLTNLLTCGHYSLWPGGVISACLSGKIVANLTAGRKPFAPLKPSG
ncbi:MAG: NAD(P)/FAD-dependent oxidoreductase [Spirochaetes bacterium]|nr:NAD(P)/FAD-dependent oxidoreductase [Spirochaetota bacterium]